MRVKLWLLALLTVPALTLACDDSPTSPGDAPITFSSVVRRPVSGYLAPRQEVIRDPESWARAWDQVYAGSGEVPARPAVDFDQEMVALAAMGSAINGCFSVEVTAIHLRRGAALEFEVTETEPGATCVCPQVITQPVHVVRLDRIAMPESFRVRRQIRSC